MLIRKSDPDPHVREFDSDACFQCGHDPARAHPGAWNMTGLPIEIRNLEARSGPRRSPRWRAIWLTPAPRSDSRDPASRG
jgi:hypothetical protein